jgi:hypothetical protein
MNKKPVCLCKCGKDFRSRRELILHIAIHNVSWPRSRPDDQHGDIKAEVSAQPKTRKKRSGYYGR